MIKEKKVIAQIDAIIHNTPLSRGIVYAIDLGLQQPSVHLTGRTVWQVFQNSLDAAIRDIETHPRGKLFRRLLEYGPPDPDMPEMPTSDGETVLSDPECNDCIKFIYSHMVNRFKGELAELLSIESCISLVEHLQQEGLLSAHIHIYFGETIAERRRIRRFNGIQWGGYVKGPDGLLVEEVSTSALPDKRSATIKGLVEIKSMPKSKKKLLAQLEQHVQRLQGGIMLDGKPRDTAQVNCFNPFFITVVPSKWKISRQWQRKDTVDGWQLILPDAVEPPVTTTFERIQPDYWRITLAWSKEALEQAAYEMTFWYMSQVGKVIYARKPVPTEWQDMSPEEAGYNAIKMMLYYVILRYLHPDQGQQAIKLYNAYSYGYPLAVDVKDMIWPEDLKGSNQS